MVPSEHVIALSAALFVIGMIGALVRRSLLAILMSIQLMLAAAGLAFIGFNRMWAGVALADTPSMAGQVFVVLLWAVAAAQVAVGLGVVLALFRNRESLDVEDASLLRW